MSKYDFLGLAARHAVDLSPQRITTLQLNITKLCNQACTHCHVDASPRRREMMSDSTIADALDILRRETSIDTLDITGGAPELHPKFRELVTGARALGKKVIIRHNLTVTHDPHPMTKESMAWVPDFFAKERVEIVSSLPYYQEFFTDKQRGDGVFKKSIKSLKMLNELGFGMPGSASGLHLVYNPVGAFLPAPQESLEQDYRKSLRDNFGIEFTSLFAMTNIPINRFKAQLVRLDGYEEYMEKLVAAFNPVAASGVMCRSLISVAWDGTLYDCDFNQMLDMPILNDTKKMTLSEWNTSRLTARTIRFDDHCFGCTAGAGSSCGGATT